MTRRVLLGYLTITVLVLLILEVPLAVFYAQREQERTIADLEGDVSVVATLFEDQLERGLEVDPTAAEEYARRTGARVVVVDVDGTTLVDTDTDQPTGRDFLSRPEIATALTGERASGIRPSDTLGTDLVYVAVPVASSGTVHGAIRATVGIDDVTERIRRFWIGLAGVAAVVLMTAAVVGWFIARSVTRPIRELNATAARYAGGDLTPATEPTSGPPEVRALGDTMSTMAGRLDELLRSQRAFVADASHQLRTPLTSLRLRLENLQSRVDDDQATELDSVIEETDRLAALVNDLLALARADEAPPTAPVDLAGLATDRVDTWAAAADLAGTTLVAEVPAGPVVVDAVPGAVEQILDNLIDNATRAAGGGGTVRVAVVAGDDRARLVVADDGPGLGDDEKAVATNRFWRGSTTEPGGGSGLGLAIVDTLATACGATTTLADAPEGGLAVTVAFRRGGAPAG